MISWLLLGFSMGLRHSLEADHVAAVASLSERAASPRDLMRVAGAWGIGHALTLLAVALLGAGLGVSIPDPAQRYVEVAAGLLLIWLGIDLIRPRDGARTSVLPHQHSDGNVHVHLHWRMMGRCEGRTSHEHPDSARLLRRALIVGAVHGLAGSALIGLLAAGSAHPGRAISFAGLFGLGAAAGMVALSTVISLPLRSPRIRAFASLRSCRVAVALVSITIGIWIALQASSVAAPPGA